MPEQAMAIHGGWAISPLAPETTNGQGTEPVIPSTGGTAPDDTPPPEQLPSGYTGRPLYRLDELEANPGSFVVVCQGEEAADAADELIPKTFIATAPHESGETSESDWAPLAKRRVMVWPTAGELGEQYAEEVARLIPTDATVRILDVASRFNGMAEGWDATDALKNGWTGPDTKEAFGYNRSPASTPKRQKPHTPTGEDPHPEPKPEPAESKEKARANEEELSAGKQDPTPNSGDPPSWTGDTGDTGDNPDFKGKNPVTSTPSPTGDTGDKPTLAELARLPLAEWGDRQWASRPSRPRFILDRHGVWHEGEDKDGNPSPPQWVCGPLVPAARTRDADGEAWGMLLVWWDPDGTRHRWAMPARMLSADGKEYRGILQSLGLQIAPSQNARNSLTTYIQTASPDTRARNVPKLGWHQGAFVLPDTAIGQAGDELILQTEGEPPKLRHAGTVKDWRDNVAALAAGNSRVILALSAAFAGPLLELVGEDSGGIHFVGGSSVGKTITARAAVSVWGGPEYMQQWRATSNGLEATAQAHNDALLVLDELAQVNAHEAGEVAYMLANGEGKARASKDGLAKPKSTWRLFFVSTGEVGLTDHMRTVGKKAKAGQEVRLADVPADAGAGFGIFEDLHNHAPATLAETLRRNAATYYGTPARAYLEGLAQTEREPLVERVRALTGDFEAEAVPEGADGQVRRVATRFALAAAGGELATAFGITGWESGEAMGAAQQCFRAWLERRGGAQPHEDREVLEQVAHFLEKHGEARFVNLDQPEQRRDVPNRAGFRQAGSQGPEFFIFPNVWQTEVCEGLDHRRAAQVLAERGWLEHEPNRHSTLKRIPGEGRKRMIHLNGAPDASA